MTNRSFCRSFLGTGIFVRNRYGHREIVLSDLPNGLTSTLTFVGTGVADETITVGDVVLTFKNSPSDKTEVKAGGNKKETAAAVAGALNNYAASEYGPGVNSLKAEATNNGEVIVTASGANAGVSIGETTTNGSWFPTGILGGDSDGPTANFGLEVYEFTAPTTTQTVTLSITDAGTDTPKAVFGISSI